MQEINALANKLLSALQAEDADLREKMAKVDAEVILHEKEADTKALAASMGAAKSVRERINYVSRCLGLAEVLILSLKEVRD